MATKTPQHTPPKAEEKPQQSQDAAQNGEQGIPWRQVRQETTRLGKRWRRQALPLVAIGATHGVGALASALTGAAVMVPVAAGWAASAGVYGYAHGHTSRWDRVYAGMAAGGSALGQAAVAIDGGAGVAASLVWACGAALAVPWWVRHAEPEPDVTAELAALHAPRPALPSAPPGRRIELWETHVAARDKALPGSTLTEVTDFAYGWQATVQLAIGEHWHLILKARRAILSVYDLPDGRIFVEAIPGASVRKTRMTVLTCDPLQSVTKWQRPGLAPETGTFPVMVTADGELLHWRFWWPGGGACHGLVSGVQGSGKTKVLDLILTEAIASDRIVPFIVDGGGGASLPQWRERVNLFAETPTDARKLLRYLLRVMDQRRIALKRQGGGVLEPTPDMPLLVCVIDEAHKRLMDDEDEGVDNRDVRRMCEKLAQEGRKFGIALVLATQVPSANQLGGSTVLRDQLKGGTVIGLRVTERTSGNMISSGAPLPEGLHELPAEFPDGKPTRGLGYVLTSRMIRSRSILIEHPEQQPTVETRLDPDSAREPVPALTGGPDPGIDTDQSPRAETGETTVQQRVQEAIDAGTNPDPLSLMQATGITLRQARQALAAQTAGGDRRC